MKKLIQLFILIMLLASSLPAQEWPDFSTQLRRMETEILRARTLADRYQNVRAQILINRAQTAFITARDLASNRRFAEARAKFLEARELISQSTRILLYRPAITLKLELDQLIQDAEQAISDNPGVEGQYLLNRARTFQSKALTAFNQTDYLSGEKYFRIARFFARKSLQLTGEEKVGKDWSAEFLDQINAQENLYQEIESSVSDNSDAADVLRKTKFYLKEARAEFENKNRKEAFANLQIAERFLLRAIDLSREGDAAREDRINDGLVSLRQFLDGVELDSERNKNENARNLLRKANHFYRGAVRDLENGRIKAAQNKINLAQRMGSRALRITDTEAEIDSDRIPDRIAELNTLIELQASKLVDAQNDLIPLLHEEAKKLLNDSRLALEKGNNRRAYALVELSLRIISRIEYLLKFEKSSSRNDSDFQSEYQKINNSLSLIIQNNQISETDKNKALILSGLLANAGRQYEQNNFETALELLSIIQNQLNEVIKSARY